MTIGRPDEIPVSIKRDRLEKLVEMLKEVEKDAYDDALRLDGMALSGATVGEHFGNVYAAINAMALVLQEVIGGVRPEPYEPRGFAE